MSEVKPAPGQGLLFLREEEMRLAQDMLFFAMRDLGDAADAVLADSGLGRAHHRALHFIAARPGLTVGDLLGILGITKQSLARVLSALIEAGLVRQNEGRHDRRQRNLHLTEAGIALEAKLFEAQRARLLAAYRDAGGGAVDGFKRVLRGIMGNPARGFVDEARKPA
jgi:DNA-binding MarR family transcriptional regulator